MPKFCPYSQAAIKAIEAGGGPAKLARKLSIVRKKRIDPNYVGNWRYQGVAPTYVIDVELLTGVSREELRPDIFYPCTGT